MVERVGPHNWVEDFLNGDSAGPGFAGKGFLAFGGKVAQSVFLSELTARSVLAKRVRTQKRVIFDRRNQDYSITIVSDLRDFLEKYRFQRLLALEASLRIAGEAGVQAAIARFEQKTPRKTTSYTRVPETTGDTQDIPSNIGYDVDFNSIGNIYTLSLGPINPSIKMLAQEMGLYSDDEDDSEF